MKLLKCILGFAILFSSLAFGFKAPQPITCVSSVFSSTGSPYWKNITLKLTNNCSKDIDFQNSTINFVNSTPLNTAFWGNFSPLAYPDNVLVITSQKLSDDTYSAILKLHFPTYPGAMSTLPVGSSITINYGAETEAHIGNALVYTSSPVETGTLTLTNASTKPANVTSNYALVHITLNGQSITDVQLPWNASQNIPDLAPGVYNLSADNVTDSAGNVYQGVATPASVILIADQLAKSTIAYEFVPQEGKINLQLQALPSELSGYTNKPIALLNLEGAGSSVSQALTWGGKVTVSQLINGGKYSLSTPNISYNGVQCIPKFTPNSLTADGVNIPISIVTYACTQVPLNNITTNVKGAPATLNSYKVVFTPNDGTGPVTQTINLTSGSGTGTIKLTNSTIYQVSSDPVSGYAISYDPQPLVSAPNAVENITLSQGSTPIEINGQLKVCGTFLCNQAGQPIQLKGMSSHGLQWYGLNVCLKSASLDALAYNFKSNVVRLSLYVQEGGYETDPVKFTNQMNQLITEVTNRGMYALVDWHILNPGDPNYNLTRAKKFFADIATANKGKTNLLYEIANEPNGVSWATIKNYAEQIIPVIRNIDPNAVIIVGTRGWSSLGVSEGGTSQEIINNPVNASNIMYSFHFYAASHQDLYLNELDKASNSLAIFATEWGTQTYDGDGGNDFIMGNKYISLMARKKISWTNWNFSDDARSGAIWIPGTCSKNVWTDSNLKPSGVYIKSKILE